MKAQWYSGYTCGCADTYPNTTGALLVNVLVCHLEICHVCKVPFKIPSRQGFKIRARLWWGGINYESWISRYKLLYIKYINNKVLLYSTGNYIQYPVINHNGKEYEKEYVHICITESLCCTPETNTTLLINYAPI